MLITRICIGLSINLVIAFQSAVADERILDFFSEIEVHEDASMTVTETIRVRAEGNQIKRGIYRDFPTRYRTESGHNYVTEFELQAVTRDRAVEAWHIETLSNGVRVYIGQSDVYLNPGEYIYHLTYRTNRQLGFFDKHDELYWNVTGNGWSFPIDRAGSRVELPSGIPNNSVQVVAYTGNFGSLGQDYQARVNQLAQAEVVTTRGLKPEEGLTVVVTWPKGYVNEPDGWQKAGYFLSDNRSVLIAIAGVGVLLLYFLITWWRVGRDPESGLIVPLFEPPENLSPAAIRYIYRMGFDHKAYAAAIINMAVKGYLSINDEQGDYVLERQPDADPSVLSAGEHKIIGRLFGGRNSATLKKKNHASISKSVKALKTLLRREYHQTYFHTNGRHLIPALILSLVVVMASGLSLSAQTFIPFLFLSVWLSVWTFTIFVLIRQRQFLLATIFGFFEIGAMIVFATLGSWPLFGLLIALIAINILFYYLIKAPTDSGRDLMDRIEGFRLYLATAEEQRLNTLHPPDKTPQLFEKYLPYALALGVDQAWSERFSKLLAQQARTPGESGYYQPSWYRGTHWNQFGPASFASELGSSLSSAVSSSSTAPGSSSGGGGGGSSGGGGGGGGGGGW